MKNENRSYRTGFSLVQLMIVTALLGLLAVVAIPQLHAQERLRAYPLVNSGIGTAYAPAGGSNVMTTLGVYVLAGNTNTVTLTNGQSIYAPSTATAFSCAPLQNVPVWWNLAATASGAGTSNTVVGIDLTADGTYWVSNALTATIAMNGTSTNVALIYFPLSSNGTNAFSGWSQWRWSYASTSQTNNVTLLQNRLQVVR